MKYKSYSVEDTKLIAKEFAKKIKVQDVICLYGDLGVGKTAFVQGLADEFGVKGYISSPTFTIVNEYTADLPIYHFDVYRIENSDEIIDIGFDEYLYGDGICIIEWPQNIEDILPQSRYTVTISKDYTKDEQYRDIEIEQRG